MGDNSSKQLKIRRNNIQNLELDITTSDNLEIALSEPAEEEPLKTNFDSIKNSQRSGQTQIP